MRTQAKNITQLWCELIVDQLVKSGVRQFYGCPGMRNAPLLRAITLHPQTQLYNGWDERSQSYRALGYIKSSGKPAAIVCTSGTAVANFLPATIEAQKTHAPLIVLSADRPGELNATDANQTINQIEVLRDYCKEFWHASEPQETFPARALSGRIAFLTHKALQRPRGPLHLNIPLREPLDDSPVSFSDDWKAEAERILALKKNSLEFPHTEQLPTSESIETLSQRLLQAKNPLVVFGPLHGPHAYDLQEVSEFLKLYQANFSCDITSSLKFAYGADQGLIPTLDHPEVQKTLEENGPDLILHFGHRLTSKHYYGLLRRLYQRDATREIIHVGAGHYHEDPSFSFTSRWDLDPRKVLSALTKSLKEHGPIKRELFDWEPLILKKRKVIEDGPLSYPFITKRAIDTLSSAKQAFIGNSTFIRSLDSYAGSYAPNGHWQCVSHRGASGIEGHLSSTIGMIDTSDEKKSVKPTVAFMGDISLIHDLNSLILLAEQTTSETPLLVIIANNQRGGIFNLLPLAQKEEAKAYLTSLTTPHHQNFTALVQGLGVECIQAESKDGYQEALDQWNQSPRRLILEVIFDDDDNVEVYKKLKTVRL